MYCCSVDKEYQHNKSFFAQERIFTGAAAFTNFSSKNLAKAIVTKTSKRTTREANFCIY